MPLETSQVVLTNWTGGVSFAEAGRHWEVYEDILQTPERITWEFEKRRVRMTAILRGLPRMKACLTWISLILPLYTVASAAEVLVWGPSNPVSNVPVGATNLVAIAGGDFHASGLKRDGTVISWGNPSWQGINGVTNVPVGLSNVVSIAGGAGYTLALRSDGSLAMWGAIAGNTGTFPYTTTISEEATNVVALAPGTGAWHALVLRADGTVVDWGRTADGLPNIPKTARHIVSVASGSWHAVALRADGRVVCWGDNGYGQTNVPASATNIVAVAAAERITAALRADGTIITWSEGSVTSIPLAEAAIEIACPFRWHAGNPVLALTRDGKLTHSGVITPPPNATNIAAIAGTSDNGIALVGTGSPVFPGLPVNRTVISGSPVFFRAVATGAWPISYQWTRDGTNIIGATNTVLTIPNAGPGDMGAYSLVASNAYGMATNGNMLLTVLPLEIIQHPVDALQYLGGSVSFNVQAEGRGPLEYQWLFESEPIPGQTNAALTLDDLKLDQAGSYSVIVSSVDGSETSLPAHLTVQPMLVTALPSDQPIFRGGTAIFSMEVQAQIPLSYQWWWNGNVLPAATNNTLILTDVQSTHAGIYSVVLSNGFEMVTNSAWLAAVDIAAWGSQNKQTDVPPNTTNIVAVDAGGSYSIALNEEGEVIGWGNDSYGQASHPAGLTNCIAIAAGNSTSLALLGDGLVLAWGSNTAQLTNVPVNITNAVSLKSGHLHSLALTDDGMVHSWGDNSYGRTNVPAGLSNVVMISAGARHNLAVRADGIVTAWGRGDFGTTNVPVTLSNVVQVAGGADFSIALRSDGTVVGWGINTFGQTNVPAGLSNVVSIAAGPSHCLALKADGTIASWGLNSSGQTDIPEGLSNVVAIASNPNTSKSLALVGNGPPVQHTTLLGPIIGSSNVSLTIPTQSGRVYCLEYTTSLTSPVWISLPLVAGTGGDQEFTDPGGAGSEQRYYRIRRW